MCSPPSGLKPCLEASTAEMLRELAITFPTLWARPLADFAEDMADSPGLWTGAGIGRMQDGDPIINPLADGEGPYNGSMHGGFEAWLYVRGWSWQNYDGDAFFLLPLSTFAGPH